MYFRSFALVAALALQPASGLDPGRSLTQYVHRIQQVSPQGTIFSIWQSHDGYLWLATQRGLVRFDGVRFTTPENNNGVSLENVWVRSLLEDERHDLWIGTNDAGLVRLHDGAMTQYLPGASVYCLTPVRPGEFWVCTAKGLARVTNGTFQSFGAEQGLTNLSVRGASLAPDGKLWSGGETASLDIWNGTGFEHRRLATLPMNASVRAILCSRDGAVWVGTTNGLIRLKDGKERRFTAADGIADDWVASLAEGASGAVWIGTRSGFSRFQNGDIESFRSQDGLSQSMVYALREDREGSLWVGTKHGLDQFFDGRTIPFTFSEGLPSNDTGPVFEDHSGNVWVGTVGAGLARVDGRRVTVVTTRQGLAGNKVYALAEDAAGGLWAGTDAGVSRLRNGVVEQTLTTRDGLPSNTIRCLFRDSHGDMWAGTPGGAAVYRDGRFVRAPELRGPGGPSILAFGEDRDRRLLAATEGGELDVYEGSQLPRLTPPASASRNVDAFYKDQDGLLWMGAVGGGLRLFKDGKVFNYWMRDGLFDDDIYGIAADSQGRLWMACSNGIFSVLRADLLKFAAGEIRKFASEPYIPTRAMRTIECKSGVQPAVWKMRDGRLWFSTIKGVIVLDPSRFSPKLSPPAVVIEDVTVNGQPENPARIESMLPGQKNLEFRYTGLSYISPSHITFRYKLDGFDKGWTNAGARREALYANLPPGKYVFRVSACNVDGTCDEAGVSVGFALAPHYYQRGWFIPLCVMAIGLIVWLVFRLRIRGLNAQFHVILGERSRIARELHDTLIQGFSGVTMEMQALCARLASPEERSNLQEIIQDAARSLREARRSVAGLRDSAQPHSGLGAAIAQTARQITETKEVRLKLKLDRNPSGLPAEVEYNLLRIAQEAVTNSVKHAGARMIEVSLYSTAAQVNLAVKDDGSGFGQPVPNSGHYGLIGMKERAAHIGAGFRIESEPGRGTTISVRLPTRKAS